jgi:hypothetical protein
MTKILIAGLSWLLLLVDPLAVGFAVNPINAAAIKESINRRLCFDTYWLQSGYRIGASLPIEIKTEGEHFFVWINDLKAGANGPMAGFFYGRINQGRAAVILREVYSTTMDPPLPGYSKRREHFSKSETSKDVLAVPSDCSPRFDRMTDQKDLMVRTIISTMKEQLTEFKRMGLITPIDEVTLLIGDFNIDYPWTYVLVEPISRVYKVILHDVSAYDDDRYVLTGKYPITEESIVPGAKDFLARIREHTLIRKLVLPP